MLMSVLCLLCSSGSPGFGKNRPSVVGIVPPTPRGSSQSLEIQALQQRVELEQQQKRNQIEDLRRQLANAEQAIAEAIRNRDQLQRALQKVGTDRDSRSLTPEESRVSEKQDVETQTQNDIFDETKRADRDSRSLTPDESHVSEKQDDETQTQIDMFDEESQTQKDMFCEVRSVEHLSRWTAKLKVLRQKLDDIVPKKKESDKEPTAIPGNSSAQTITMKTSQEREIEWLKKTKERYSLEIRELKRTVFEQERKIAHLEWFLGLHLKTNEGIVAAFERLVSENTKQADKDEGDGVSSDRATEKRDQS